MKKKGLVKRSMKSTKKSPLNVTKKRVIILRILSRMKLTKKRRGIKKKKKKTVTVVLAKNLLKKRVKCPLEKKIFLTKVNAKKIE